VIALLQNHPHEHATTAVGGLYKKWGYFFGKPVPGEILM
jgi:hypothetical protein